MAKSMISLVGRPNVGKSSLFNALLKKKQALVMDFEGVTRDRRFAFAEPEELNKRRVRICDTGGWVPESWRKNREDKEILQNIEVQVKKALEESAVIVLVMDIREGVTHLDEEITTYIRRMGIPFVIAANKADVFQQEFQMAEFYALGADDVIPVSAEHKLGLGEFWERIAKYLPEEEKAAEIFEKPLRVAIVGRPNVGKSSFLNQLAGEERSVASAIAGTTTDPVDLEITREGRKFIVVDTAGIRRHSKRENDVEDLAVMYATRALNEADLAFMMIDAEDGITTQDSRIAALVEESGCTCIILANKWDKAPQDLKSDKEDSLDKFREIIDKEWPFLDFAPLVALSVQRNRVYGAKEGADSDTPEGPWNLPRSIDELWPFALELIQARQHEISPEELKEIVDEAFAVGPNWIEHLGNFRKMHQVGNRPPQFLAFVRDANKVPEALRRYLKRAVRARYGYRGNPIRWVFKHQFRN